MPSASSYNTAQRALHYLAFSAPGFQRVLCDLENDLFKSRLDRLRTRNEAFVTGLPRAGTTLLLELLYGTGEFATYTYRHMPFVLAPMLWQRLTSQHRKSGSKRERAHGDGMLIDFDSPEAFEEVIWMTFLGRQIVSKSSIEPVSADMLTTQFRAAMQQAMRKVLALSPHAHSAPRYLSKNNANISRLRAIASLCPTSTVFVLFREPRAHVSSLMRQHLRFVREHARNPFARRYMEWIGHFEFGRTFKPINFSNWLSQERRPISPDADFWIRYWAEAYTHALEQAPEQVCFVDFDRLVVEKDKYLQKIATAAALREPAAITRSGKILRSPTTRPIPASQCSSSALARAGGVYERLQTVAI